MRILIIDNYDSFTYILAQYFAEISNTEPLVYQNNEINLAEIEEIKPSHIVISPGPGTPTKTEDFGINIEVINELSSKIPILGVCLGHQGIIHLLGGKITHAPEPIHGKTSQITISDPMDLAYPSLFKNLPNEFAVMRYHSLIGTNLPTSLIATAKIKDSELIMAIQHQQLPLYGIQFHPESFATEHGEKILSNFLQVSM